MSRLRTRRLLMVMMACVALAEANAGGLGRLRPTRTDLDGDGIPNLVDPDVDNDGIPNGLDRNVDGGLARRGPARGTHVGDRLNNDTRPERDIDADGLPDDSLAERDIDGDGLNDDSALELDIDGDGRGDSSFEESNIDGDLYLDEAQEEQDIDGDGRDDGDADETDIDGDGLSDSNFREEDIDGDGSPDDGYWEEDMDGDGLSNYADGDIDGDGIPNATDRDAYGDGRLDLFDFKIPLTKLSGEGTGLIEFGRSVAGQASDRFVVSVAGMLPGEYDLFVGGYRRGTLQVVYETNFVYGVGSIDPPSIFDISLFEGGQFVIIVPTEPLEPEPPKPLSTVGRIAYSQELSDTIAGPSFGRLYFDPSGQTVTIQKNGQVFFSAAIPALAPISFPEFTAKRIAGVGEVTGQYEVVNRNQATLSLNMVVPSGDYEVIVNGVDRGSIHATTVLHDEWGETEWRAGELLFSTEASDQEAGAKALDFNAAGASIEIRQGGKVLFTATVPTPFQ